MTNDDDRRAAETLAYQVHEAGRQDWPKPWDQRAAATVVAEALSAAFKAGQEAKGQQISEGLDDLGEALFYLSDKLRGSGFLADVVNHAEYERVVAAYHALSEQVPGVPFRFAMPEPLCTDCLGTGLTIQTERICSCDDGADLRRITTKGDDR